MKVRAQSYFRNGLIELGHQGDDCVMTRGTCMAYWYVRRGGGWKTLRKEGGTNFRVFLRVWSVHATAPTRRRTRRWDYSVVKFPHVWYWSWRMCPIQCWRSGAAAASLLLFCWCIIWTVLRWDLSTDCMRNGMQWNVVESTRRRYNLSDI